MCTVNVWYDGFFMTGTEGYIINTFSAITETKTEQFGAITDGHNKLDITITHGQMLDIERGTKLRVTGRLQKYGNKFV